MRFISKMAAASVAVITAFSVVAALLVFSGPSTVKRAEAAAIYITPSSTTVVADGTNTVNYVITMTLESGYLTAGNITATSTLGTWRDSGTTVTSYQCLALGACASGITLVLNVKTTTGTNTVVVAGGGMVSTDSTVAFTAAASSKDPTEITVSGGGRSAALGSSTIGYTSPTTEITLTFTVKDGSGVGVNDRTLLVTTDKGGLLAATGCVSTSKIKSLTVGPTATTSSGVVGRATVRVCPLRTTGQTGTATITVSDSVITTVETETTALFAFEPVSAGMTLTVTPDTLATGESAAIEVVALDKNDTPLAREHTVTITASAGVESGTGSCVLTPSGALSFSPLDSGTVSTTLSVVGPVTNCLITAQVTGGTGPTTAAVTTTSVTVTAAGTTTAVATTGYSGTAPDIGDIGLLGVSGTPTASALVDDLEDAGCTAESIAILVSGEWEIYIPGAPAVVNAGFPATIDEPAFFVRC